MEHVRQRMREVRSLTIFAALTAETRWTLAGESTKAVRDTLTTVQTRVGYASIAYNIDHPSLCLSVRWKTKVSRVEQSTPEKPEGQMH